MAKYNVATETRADYGRHHRNLRKRLALVVARGEAVCARCRLPIAPGERWELDHDDRDKRRYLGPSHQRCNRATLTHAREAAAVDAPARTSRRW